MTRGEFVRRLLKELDAPVTLHNRRALHAQMQSEGGSAAWNPFNTTWHLPGATDYNSVHVKNYPSFEDGMKATVLTLKQDQYGYPRIISALRANRPARDTIKIIGESAWGTGAVLLAEVFGWIAKVSGVLSTLERKQVAS